MAKGKNKDCCVQNSFVRNLLLAPSDVTPPPADVCYVFEFDMQNILDELDLFTYNGGAQTINVNEPLDATAVNVKIAIITAFDTVPITYEDVIVLAQDIGDDLLHYTITIKNPSVIFSAISISGTGHTPTVTDCT